MILFNTALSAPGCRPGRQQDPSGNKELLGEMQHAIARRQLRGTRGAPRLAGEAACSMFEAAGGSIQLKALEEPQGSGAMMNPRAVEPCWKLPPSLVRRC